MKDNGLGTEKWAGRVNRRTPLDCDQLQQPVRKQSLAEKQFCILFLGLP